jgi:lipopolysaccharide export system protein LptA
LQAVINNKALQLKFTGNIVLLLLLLLGSTTAIAQQPVPAVSTADTIRIIQIIKADNLREKVIDSVTTLETGAGNVVIKEGNTITYCDSVVINHATKIVEAFGNVHINDHDSVHTYAQYLKYIGGDRIAYLKKSVKLTDKKGVLLTDELEYNLRTGIAIYKNGGKVLNGKTILTSNEGVYYANTKDIYFKKNVHLTDPKYNIQTDSLLYNANSNVATFIAPTHIVSKDGIIDTRAGTYDLNTGAAIFSGRTSIKDSSRYIIGDRIISDEKTSIVQIDGNAKLVDSINQVTVLANHVDINKKENSFLAYNKPVMILYRDNDTTYIAADTLFSGLRKYDTVQKKQIDQKDTLKKTTTFAIAEKKAANRITPSDKEVALQKQVADTIKAMVQPDSVKSDTLLKPIAVDSAAAVNILPKDSLQKNGIVKKRVTQKILSANNKADTTIRYFLGIHHVRIFNDSLQAVSDSLYYSTEDSTFRLFGQPVVWNAKTQVTGDTIYMYTESQKPKRLYVFYNSIIINHAAGQLYNQIAGRTLTGYFKEGSIDYVKVKGSPAESIYYPQDDDSAYVGMNRSMGDVIDVYFVNKELNKVKFSNNVDGVMYPLKQIPSDKKQLKNFKWLDARRPKNKLELFE